MHAAIRHMLEAAAATIRPSLRVIGLTYTGLGGMLVLVLILSVAGMPVAPVVQQAVEPARQAVEPARQAVSTFIQVQLQPPSDAVIGLFGGTPALVVMPTSLSSAVTLDVSVVDDEPLTQTPTAPAPVVEEVQPVVVFAPVPRVVPTAPSAPSAPTATLAPLDEQRVAEDEDENETAPEGVEPEPVMTPVLVVQPAEPLGLQIASEDAPRALPTPSPTETAAQARARLDAENQAAIEAAKAARARAKAQADAANQAAIDARKAAQAGAKATDAGVVSAPAPTATEASQPSTAVAEPTSVPTSAPRAGAPKASAAEAAAARSKAELDAANQAAIDAARAAKLNAHNQANANNQAAIDAARGAKAASRAFATPMPEIKVVPTATPQPPAEAAAEPASAGADGLELQADATGVDDSFTAPAPDAMVMDAQLLLPEPDVAEIDAQLFRAEADVAEMDAWLPATEPDAAAD